MSVLRVWVSLFPKINIIIHPMIYWIFLVLVVFFKSLIAFNLRLSEVI